LNKYCLLYCIIQSCLSKHDNYVSCKLEHKTNTFGQNCLSHNSLSPDRDIYFLLEKEILHLDSNDLHVEYENNDFIMSTLINKKVNNSFFIVHVNVNQLFFSFQLGK
jgi:hypothetical protein